MVLTEDQVETDRYWNAIVGGGGVAQDRGWCRDRWGFRWQMTPRRPVEALAAGGAEASRAFAAMMTMRRIDVGAIDAARRLMRKTTGPDNDMGHANAGAWRNCWYAAITF